MYYGDEEAVATSVRQHLDDQEIMVVIMAALVVMEDT